MAYSLNDGLWKYIIDFGLTEIQVVFLTLGFTLIAVISGYLLGSINSAILVSKVLYNEDIRTYGSGNAGLTNMLRTYGKGAAGLTLLGDFLKTAISVVIGCILGGFGYAFGISIGGSTCAVPLGYVAGFFAIIGHVYPIFYKFRGGKGVLCTAVMALILSPIVFLLLLGVFALIVATTKYVSLGSVCAAVLYPVAVHGHIQIIMGGQMQQSGISALITVFIAIFVVYLHRENLKRISYGTERKLSIGKKPQNKN